MDADQKDRFLAEKLMGWFTECDDDSQQYMWMRENTIDGEPDFVMFQKIWHPSTDISQALGNGQAGTVVGEMRKLGWEFTLDDEDVGFLKQGWCAEFLLRKESTIIHDIDSHGVTPSEVIVNAACEALELEHPQCSPT